MGISHASVDAPGVLFPLAFVLTFVARFSPMLFFSVSGVVNALQARRYPFRYFAAFAALFAFYGLTYNALWRGDVWHGLLTEFTGGHHTLAGDIPQYLAMVIVITVAVEKLWTRAWIGYLIVAAGSAAVHFLLNARIPDFPFRQWFLVTDPKVFPLFPWLVFPMLGNLAYRLSDTAVYRVTQAMGLLCVLVFTLHVSQNLDLMYLWTEKYSMPVGYFLLSVFVQCSIFSIMRRWGSRLVNPTVLYVGRHSFPYLYLHILWIRLFEALHIRYALVVWPAVIILAVLSVRAGEYLNQRFLDALFAKPAGWYALGVLTLLGIFLSAHTPGLLIITGVIFSYNYRQLAVQLKTHWKHLRHSPAALT